MRITLLSGGCGQNKVEQMEIKVLCREPRRSMISTQQRVSDARQACAIPSWGDRLDTQRTPSWLGLWAAWHACRRVDAIVSI